MYTRKNTSLDLVLKSKKSKYNKYLYYINNLSKRDIKTYVKNFILYFFTVKNIVYLFDTKLSSVDYESNLTTV